MDNAQLTMDNGQGTIDNSQLSIVNSPLVPPGYKQTEVGVIPDDWELATLGELCAFENGDRGINYPSRASFRSSGIPFVNAGHLEGGHIKINELDYISRDSFDLLGGGKFGPGDILYCLRGSLGKFGVVDTALGEGAIASSLVIVRAKSINLNRVYLSWYFRSAYCTQMIDKWAGGAAQPNLGAQDLARFVIPIPPTLTEQEAIAAALSDADALIEALEQLIAKKRQVKQGAMQELLTGKRRLPGFSGEWEKRPLSNLAMVNKGQQLHSTETHEYGRYAHLNGGIAPSGYTDKSNTPGNTIAISEGGNSCGYVQFMSEPFWSGGHCYAVTADGLDNQYLFYALKQQEPSIMGLRVGSGLPNVQKTALLALEVRYPSAIAEQTAIAAILSDMDAEIAALEEKLTKARQVKQGMMQELLTGRTRLIDN